GEAQAEELGFWTDELSKDGALIMQRRAAALAEISGLAADYHRELAEAENLGVSYQPRTDSPLPEPAFASADEIAECLKENFTRGLTRDIAAGITLQGPHRDEILFALNDLPAAGYASRAQQRSIALSLRLAEAELVRHWLLARDLQPSHSLVVHALRSVMPSEQRERRQPDDVPAATPLVDADIEESVIHYRIRCDLREAGVFPGIAGDDHEGPGA